MNENFMKNAENQNVVDNGIPRSGVNLSHASLGSGCIGHIIPINQELLLPNSRISGSNDMSLTFEPLVSQRIEPVFVEQYNSLCRVKALYGRSEFENLLLNKQNDSDIFDNWASYIIVIRMWFRFIFEAPMTGSEEQMAPVNMRSFYDYYRTRIRRLGGALNFGTVTHDYIKKSHTLQFFSQYSAYLGAYEPSVTDTDKYIVWYMLKPIFGEGSLLDQLGYPILSYEYMVNHVLPEVTITFPGGRPEDGKLSWQQWAAFFTITPIDWENVQLNTLALRHYYAFWYEFVRDRSKMPANDINFDYHAVFHPKWISGNNHYNYGAVFNAIEFTTLANECTLLIPRLAHWQTDMYMSASIDDLSRHVYLPVTGSTGGSMVLQNSNPAEGQGTTSVLSQGILASETIQYITPDGSQGSLQVHLPLNTALNLTNSTSGSSLQIDLRRLRHSSFMENVLKRLFYYGADEYPEYIMALYGSQIADFSVYRPQLLSASRSQMDVSQVQPVTDSETFALSDIGPQRRCQMQGSAGGDGFSTFVDEFSHLLSIVVVKPRVQYDPTYHGNCIVKSSQLPLPQFSMDNEEISSVHEFARSRGWMPFGHHVYGHNWRQRVSEVHGRYLLDYKNQSFQRLFTKRNGLQQDIRNNADFLICNPSLEMFADKLNLDPQFYYTIGHTLLAEVPLASPTTIL